MKKKGFLALLFAMIMVFSLSSCGNTSGMDKDTERIIESFFNDKDNLVETIAWMEENYTKYPKLSSEEIEQVILENDWLSLELYGGYWRDWWSFEFEDGKRNQRYHYFKEGNKNYIEAMYVAEFSENCAVEDDVLYLEPSSMGYEVYKMHDNFYLLKKVSGKFYEYGANDYIYTQVDTNDNLIYENPSWEKYILYSRFK